MKNVQNIIANAALIAAAMGAQDQRILKDSGGGYEHGQVLFANDSRLLETYYQEALTNYITGWKDPSNIEASLNFIAPEVQVARRFEYKKAVNAEALLSETDDIRAIGADFKQVEYSGTDVTARTLNKGLSVVVDLDQVAGTGWRNQKLEMISRRLLRNDYRRGVALLTASATNTAKTWDTTSGNDPDQDITTELIAGNDASGIMPNRIIYGHTAWAKRLLAHRAQLSAGGFASSGMTPEELAAFLQVDQVLVDKTRYQSSASAKSQVVSNLVIAFTASDGVDEADPSNLKRFVTPFSGEQGGGVLRVYEQQISAKLVVLTVEHYSNILAPTTLGIRQLTIS